MLRGHDDQFEAARLAGSFQLFGGDDDQTRQGHAQPDGCRHVSESGVISEIFDLPRWRVDPPYGTDQAKWKNRLTATLRAGHGPARLFALGCLKRNAPNLLKSSKGL
jgi:hypothetical protein